MTEKGGFEGWVNQFEKYATFGQWNEEEKASPLFLSLTAGARMYFVGLPEREKMVYATRVETLRRRFGQETDINRRDPGTIYKESSPGSQA